MAPWIGISVPDDSTNKLQPNFISRGVLCWHSRSGRLVHPNAVPIHHKMCLEVLYNISQDCNNWSPGATRIVFAMTPAPVSGSALHAPWVIHSGTTRRC
ncbi:hypothetical protein EJB05_06266 [Eragrostis curvula]|uniref:Uncharacterized protein n=1 Tax=Eragrostis curvula TaxID=38414 RepID=A0A5J9WFI4_9POAL|nr:hypothetical protein EJB05_06266 [Eragrostis curvula]